MLIKRLAAKLGDKIDKELLTSSGQLEIKNNEAMSLM